MISLEFDSEKDEWPVRRGVHDEYIGMVQRRPKWGYVARGGEHGQRLGVYATIEEALDAIKKASRGEVAS